MMVAPKGSFLKAALSFGAATLSEVIGAIFAFHYASLGAESLRPWGWFAIGAMAATLIFGLAYVVLQWRWQVQHAEWTALRKARTTMTGFIWALAQVIFNYVRRHKDSELALDSLLRCVVTSGQRAIAIFSPHTMFAVKRVVEDRDGRKFIECVYPEDADLDSEKLKIKAELKNIALDLTFVGKLISEDKEFLFATDFSALDPKSLPFHPDQFQKDQQLASEALRYRKKLIDDCGVRGVVVWRVLRQRASSSDQTTWAAIKIFCFKENCIRDTPAIRTLLTFYSLALSLVMHLALTLQEWRRDGKQEGFKEGYKKGSAEGREAGKREAEQSNRELTTAAHGKGKQEGLDEGQKRGFDEGRIAGKHEAEQVAQDVILAAYEKGKLEGSTKALTAGGVPGQGNSETYVEQFRVSVDDAHEIIKSSKLAGPLEDKPETQKASDFPTQIR